MKIVFLLPGNIVAGGVYVAYQQAHYLAAAGYDVTIVFASTDHGLDVRGYPGFALETRALHEVIDRQTRFDVVLATWWETFYEMFAINAERHFYFCQSDERRFYASRADFEVPFVEKTYCDPRVGIVTEARWIHHWLEDTYGATVEYAPNGIDTTQFHGGVTPLTPRGDRLRVLIEGPGSVAHKRVDLAYRVASRIPNIELWYVSNDGVVHPSWRLTRTFKHVAFQDMPAIYASCDILLKLSTVEGFFGPPLEMMACGGSVIVTKVTGHDEYIRPDQNALAVELDDEEAAHRALVRLVGDPTLRRRLATAGMATAQAMDWRDRSPLFAKAVQRLCERTQPMPAAARADYLVLDRLRQRASRHERRQAKLLSWPPVRALQALNSWKGTWLTRGRFLR